MSSLRIRISFIIFCLFIADFNFPVVKPLSFNIVSISRFSILSNPSIFIFHMNLDNPKRSANTNIITIKNTFLFLYLCKIKGSPFLSNISILHFVSFAIFRIFLNSFIPTLVYIIVDFSLFMFQKNILLLIHLFINFSTK